MYADGVSKKTQILSQKRRSQLLLLPLVIFSVLLLPEEEETQLHTLTCLENNGNVERLYSERTSAVTRNFQGGFHSCDVSIRKCFCFVAQVNKYVEDFKGENMRP